MSLIDKKRIPFRKVCDVLDKFKLKHVADLYNLKGNGVSEKEPGYLLHTETYFVDAPRKTVFNQYLQISPAKAWTNSRMDFALMFDKNSGKIYYQDHDDFPAMEPNVLTILNLHFFNRLLQLSVGHEIELIDHEEYLIKSNYLESSVSRGSQFLRFFEDEPAKTRIVHDTYYKSDSKFRDRYIYPPAHTITIGAFHANMKQLILGK